MKKSDGFTLVELLISVVIVGILVAVALPNYREYVLTSNRAEAHAALLDMASRQERFVAQRNTYTTEVVANTGLGLGTANTESDYYTLSAEACPGGDIADCYIVIADAIGSQVGDADCAQITYDSRGRKGGTTGDCW